MKIEYSNMPKNVHKINFVFRYLMNYVRSWILFNLKYPWIQYTGFVRVMSKTRFAKRNIKIGHNVQFGHYCNISTDVIFGNNILMAGRVSFVGKNDHIYNIPGQFIWKSGSGENGTTIIEDDVWIGHNVTIIGGLIIGKGSIIAAGSVLNKNVPSCEIWGGVPARKIKNRFESEEETNKHLIFLEQL